jgi:hypothetical protein
MFGSNYYFSTIRKYVTLFGTLFDDINITRTNSAGKTTQIIKVPITYGPKDKMLARVTEDPNIDRQTAIQLPVMSFEMTDFSYDGSRKLESVGRSVVQNPNNNGQLYYQYNPVPYDIGFSLYVYVKNAEDGSKIVEQILPYFTPDWTVKAELIPQMNQYVNIPVILDKVSIEDVYEGNFKDRRALVWVLNFTLKGYIYGPVKNSTVIKFANTEFYIPNVADGQLSTAVGNTPHASVLVQNVPGLTANGQPTSNSAQSIPVSSITANSNYGFVTTITEVNT